MNSLQPDEEIWLTGSHFTYVVKGVRPYSCRGLLIAAANMKMMYLWPISWIRSAWRRMWDPRNPWRWEERWGLRRLCPPDELQISWCFVVWILCPLQCSDHKIAEYWVSFSYEVHWVDGVMAVQTNICRDQDGLWGRHVLSIVSVRCHSRGPDGCLRVLMYSWYALVDVIELVLVKRMKLL